MQLICTLTPSSSNAEETHNTLKFAHRAKCIEIQASQNKVSPFIFYNVSNKCSIYFFNMFFSYYFSLANIFLLMQIIDEKSLIKKYQNEIRRLKDELDQLKRGIVSGTPLKDSGGDDIVLLKQKVGNLLLFFGI